MIYFVILLSYFSNSGSSDSSIFVGNWYSGLNLKDKSIFSLQFSYYYQIPNNQNESTLIPVKEHNINGINLLCQDCFLFAVGKLRLKQSNYIVFPQRDKIIAGIYQMNTSEFYMVHFIEDFLPDHIIKKIDNFDNPPIFKNEKELFSFLFKMKSISDGFNISKQESIIMKTDIKNIILKYPKNDKIKNEKEYHEYYKMQLIIEQLKNISMEKFDINISNLTDDQFFPLIYLKINDNSKLKMKFDINNSLEGFFICDTNNDSSLPNFIELKARQIDYFSFKRSLRNFCLITFLSSTIIFILTNKINLEMQYQTQFRYFWFISYDIVFAHLLELFSNEICIFNNIFSTILYFIHIGLHIMSIENFKRPFGPIELNVASLKRLLILLIQFYFCAIPIKKLNEKLNDYSNIVIFYLSLSLIPQIVFNYYNPFKNIKRAIYMFLVMYIRLYEISYYFLNIKNKCKNMIIFAFIIISIQSLILIIQSLFRSVFYTKKIRKENGFKYYNKRIETKTECPICYCDINPHSYDYMITPCNHVFHEDCLIRWMNEHMSCPMCRSNLPPIQAYPSLI